VRLKVPQLTPTTLIVVVIRSHVFRDGELFKYQTCDERRPDFARFVISICTDHLVTRQRPLAYGKFSSQKRKIKKEKKKRKKRADNAATLLEFLFALTNGIRALRYSREFLVTPPSSRILELNIKNRLRRSRRNEKSAMR